MENIFHRQGSNSHPEGMRRCWKEIVYMSADTLDLMNSGDLVTDFVESQSHIIAVQEQPMQKKKKIV
jgi:hypothetical protein